MAIQPPKTGPEAEQQVYESALLGLEQAAFDEHVGQGRALASGPGGAGLGELGGVQEVGSSQATLQNPFLLASPGR